GAPLAGLEPAPTDWKSTHSRLCCRTGCRPCRSGEVARPGETALARGVASGGMTNGMTAPATGWRKPPPCTAVRNASETELGHAGPRPAEFGTMTAPEGLDAPTTMGMTPAARPVGGRWPAVLAWALWLLVPLGWAATAWLDGLLPRPGGAEGGGRGAATLPAVVGTVTAATVGGVLASRRPHHPVGWLLLGLGLS